MSTITSAPSLAFAAHDRALAPAFTLAFQPIVDVRDRSVCSFEALVRGISNEPASEIFDRVLHHELYAFDQQCRAKAIALATQLGISCDLNLNLLPQGILAAGNSIRSLVDSAGTHSFALDRIVLEVTEGELIGDQHRFAALTDEFREVGLKLAIDDFGAGYSGLNLLADFQPDQIKLDKKLVRGIPGHGPRQAIVRAIVQFCRDLGIDLIAEGVETHDEYSWFCDEGVTLFQGYLFARPGFECLPQPVFPAAALRGSHAFALGSKL